MLSTEDGMYGRARRSRIGGAGGRWLLVVTVLCPLVFSAGCSRWTTRRASVFAGETPTADDVVAIINRNAEQAQGLIAKDLDISSNQVPIPLGGHLALQKPRNFRMIVKAPLTHTTVADIGSNEDEFWVYASPPNQRASLVHCSYEDYGRVQSPLPLQPDWIFESIGFMPLPLDSNYVINPGKRGTVELVSSTNTPQGQPASLVTVVQLNTGYIVERRLETLGQSRPIARASLSRHQKDPASGVVYPTSISINWPEQGMDISIRLDDVQVNPRFDPYQAQELWRLPRDQYVLDAGSDIDLGAGLRSSRPRLPDNRRTQPRRGLLTEPDSL
jgi:hypothetical protein